jgi:hypothetical protein
MYHFKDLWDSDEWDHSQARGNMTGDQAFFKAIRDNKPNYISMGQWDEDAQFMTSKKPDLVKEAAKLIGFNFSIISASFADEILANQAQEISISIENSGVTNMLTDCVIKLVLLNSDDEVVSYYKTNWDAKSILGGTSVTFKENVVFSETHVGAYKLALGLYRNENDQMPTYKMDNKGRTQNGFYLIGNLKME